jgi:hypothetical protein
MGSAYRQNASDYLDNLYGAVSILHKPNNSITLSGSGSATIPITVQNDLPQPVLNLEVELTSSSPTRLSLGKETPSSKILPVRANGDTVQTLRFPVKATANGQVDMVAQLYTTTDQKPYGGAVGFTVNIKQLRNGVIAVVAGGVLLVLLAGVRLYSKRKHAQVGEGVDEDDDATAAGDDDEDGNNGAPEKGARQDQKNTT